MRTANEPCFMGNSNSIINSIKETLNKSSVRGELVEP